ncbi:MAG TPA: NAD(P)-dependent oxidoreductase [Gammaproteobacteria bacterium]|nr:NAD(P)-dependent oxidoreductase [Gammaproteobacteria bacterium]
MPERVLVTGGSGFMGTNLVQDLVADGVEVLSLDHSPPLHPGHFKVWRDTDLLDVNALSSVFQEFKPDRVVHLAARTDLDKNTTLDDYAANTVGTSNLLDAVEKAGTVRRLLVTSSMLVCRLGYIPGHDEDYAPNTRYGESKVITEKVTRERDISATWALLRPTTIWGPWHVRLQNEFIRVLQKGHYFHPGGKPCRRSYGFVGNSVHQIRRLLDASAEKIHRKTFYIGDPDINLVDYVNGFSRRIVGRDVRIVPYPAMKLGALIGDLLSTLGWKGVPLTSYRLSNMTRDNVLDVSGTLDVTGQNPYSLEEGIERTMVWLETNRYTD